MLEVGLDQMLEGYRSSVRVLVHDPRSYAPPPPSLREEGHEGSTATDHEFQMLCAKLLFLLPRRSASASEGHPTPTHASAELEGGTGHCTLLYARSLFGSGHQINICSRAESAADAVTVQYSGGAGQ